MSTNFSPTPAELTLVSQIFAQADPQKLGVLTGDVAVRVFGGAKLPPVTLAEIWSLSDEDDKGWLPKKGVAIAVRLIGWAQKGEKITQALANKPGPLAVIEGINTIAQQTTGVSLPKSPPPPAFPPLTNLDKAKFQNMFVEYGPENGLLSGDKSRDIFVKSKLSNEQLLKIWNLADTQDRGALDAVDFAIGMYFIQGVVTKKITFVPTTLPPGLYQQAGGSTNAGSVRPHMTGGSGSFSPVGSFFPPQHTVQMLQPEYTGSLTAPSLPARPNALTESNGHVAEWDVTTAEKAACDLHFNTLDTQRKGFIEGEIAVPFMLKSQLPGEILAQVWDLADINNDGCLTRDGFAIAMHLIQKKLAGQEVPAILPPSLVPPSKRQPTSGASPFSPATSQHQPPEPLVGLLFDDTFDFFSFDDTPLSSAGLMQTMHSTGTVQSHVTTPTPNVFPPVHAQRAPEADPFSVASPLQTSSPHQDLPSNDAHTTSFMLIHDQSVEIGNMKNQLQSTSQSLATVKEERGTLEQTLAGQTLRLSMLQTQLSSAKARFLPYVSQPQLQSQVQPSQPVTHGQSSYRNLTVMQPQMQVGPSSGQGQFPGMIWQQLLQQQQQQQLFQDVFNQGQPQMYATCWIAAEHALRHVERYRSQIETTFEHHDIRRSQYAVCAGFDESCIRRGSGYLEQIHIFTLSTILATSPLLTELGKILSPFSSILFTESSQFSLPVYKDDGTIWEFEELVFETASKYFDHGSTAAMCPTVISLSQTTNNEADESQQDSGGGDEENVEEKDSRGSEEKGNGQNRNNENRGENPGDPSRDGNHGSDHPANSGDRDIDGGPDDPDPEEGTKETTNSPNIAFEVVSNIYTNGNLSQIFQQINTAGELTVRMDNNPKRPTCQVQFTKLEFGNETPTPDVAYHQFHCRVIIDSRLNSRITGAKPERTCASEKETTVTVSGKMTETKTGSGTIGASTSGFNIGATGAYARAAEEGTSSATKQFNSKITKQAKLGVVWWGFDVHDANLQQGGKFLEEPELPTATFHFRTEASKYTPVPDHIDIEVASYWSIIPSPTVASNIGWLSKILPLTSNDSPVIQYSHLCQMTALKIPPDLKEHSDYCAVLSLNTTGGGLHFKTDISHPGSESVEIDSQVIRRMDSTPFKYEDVRKSSLELPNFIHHLVSSDNMWNGPAPQQRKNAEQASTASMATATNEQ